MRPPSAVYTSASPVVLPGPQQRLAALVAQPVAVAGKARQDTAATRPDARAVTARIGLAGNPRGLDLAHVAISGLRQRLGARRGNEGVEGDCTDDADEGNGAELAHSRPKGGRGHWLALLAVFLAPLSPRLNGEGRKALSSGSRSSCE